MILERTIQKLLVDSHNTIWVANNKGLNRFDRKNTQFSLFVPNPANPSSKADNALVSLAEDRAGRILGGTIGKGLYVFDVNTQVFRHYMNDPNNPDSLPDDSIWRILIDSEHTVWLSQARSGIVAFDVDNEKFTPYPNTYGQPGSLAYGLPVPCTKIKIIIFGWGIIRAKSVFMIAALSPSVFTVKIPITLRVCPTTMCSMWRRIKAAIFG